MSSDIVSFLRSSHSPLHALANQSYVFSVHDGSSNSPFLVDKTMIDALACCIRPKMPSCVRAQVLFSWMERNVKYGDAKRKTGYRTSIETMQDKEGVCGEMAFVYVVLARCSGLQSNFVIVTKDYANKKVQHACAQVHAPGPILVDTSYHTYNIDHKEYCVLNDEQVRMYFQKWRR